LALAWPAVGVPKDRKRSPGRTISAIASAELPVSSSWSTATGWSILPLIVALA
jgi:hypothetical protein